jgi:hypothetical protein
MKKFMVLALLVLGVAVFAAPPVMAQEDKPFTIHGEFRFRGESTENTFDFDDDGDDSFGYWPYRVRLAAEGRFGKNVGVWIEFQNTGVAGGVPTGPFRSGSDACDDVFFGDCDGDSAELYQANITIDKLWSDNFNVRIGRSEIVAGNELHLGDLDFYSGISHDGLSGTWNLKDWSLMIFYTVVNEGSTSTFDANLPPFLNGTIFGPGDESVQFFGGYWTYNSMKKHQVEAYVLELKTGGLVGFDVMTVGGRWASKNAEDGLFWNLEGAIQTGDVDTTTDAGGQVIEGWIGYTFNKAHSVYGKYASAQGDDGGTADEFEGFISLFGDFHNRLGRGDWFRLDDNFDFPSFGSGGGIDAVSVGYKFHPNDKHSIGAAYWDYSFNETGGDDAIGSALDVWYDHNYNKNLAFSIALSQFDPDDNYGGADSDTVRRLYGQARLRF